MRFSCAYLTFYIKSQFAIIILRLQVNITCRTGFLDQKFKTLDIHMQVLQQYDNTVKLFLVIMS